MKTTRSLLLAFCALLSFSTAQATTVIAPTFDELVSDAQLIFQGTVTNVKAEWLGEGGQRHIMSYVTFRVEDGIKGDAGSTYTIRMLGGTVDGQTMEVSDSPKFAVGDRDILFVENNGSQFIPLVGIKHGRFQVRHDEQTGTEVVLTHHGETLKDVAQLGKEEHAHEAATKAAPASGSLRAEDFKAAIKSKLALSDR